MNNDTTRDFLNKDTSQLKQPMRLQWRYLLNLQRIGGLINDFDSRLNHFIYQIGQAFNVMSIGLRRFLHTGYWRRYAMVIFFSLISLMLFIWFMV